MRKFLFILAIILIAAVTTAVYFYYQQPETSIDLRQQAEKSAHNGGQWLLNYEGNFGDPGVPWIIQVINKNYCHNQEVEKFVSERFQEEFAWHPVERGYQRLFDRQAHLLPSEDLLRNSQLHYNDILLPALYCDIEPVPEETMRKIFDIEQAGGYDLTHKFLAIIFLKNNNCFSTDNEEIFITTRAKIKTELAASNSFSDLFAEQVAFLEYGGAKNEISPQWIETIIRNQLLSGGWIDSRLPAFGDNPHTTALSVWALSEYAQTCPF